MWQLAGETLTSRFLLGTARYPSLHTLQAAIMNAEVNVITVALKRETALKNFRDDFFTSINKLNCRLLPNTAGCHHPQEAITAAEMARELFATNWIKLEVLGDDYTLQPDPFGLVQAARELVQRGFVVFPYCTDDLVLCQRLRDCGCDILMPWGAPIGSGQGLMNPFALATLRSRLHDVTLIIDAGIGKPSHATLAMELGFDGVLLNTAVAAARDPIKMAGAFRDAIIAGRQAFEAGMIAARTTAQASTALIDTPFWLQRGNT